MTIPAVEPSPAAASDDSPTLGAGYRTALRWLACFVAIGVTWRVLRFVLQFPIWGDEAYACLNFIDRGYLDILNGVKYSVVQPLLFLWGELTMYRELGGSEMSMRLLPTLFGLVALPLFWRLTGQVLTPQARVVAMGVLAVSYYPVRHACEVRPYSLDLLVSITLMSLALAWIAEPQRWGRLVVLCLVSPLGLLLSHPAVFVAGGVSLALLPTVWRQAARIRVLWVAYNVALGGAFLVCLYLNARMQPASNIDFLRSHWGHAFPPHEPLELLKWLVVTHTSNMMAYPIGGKNGASVLTLALFSVGVWSFIKSRRWDVLWLTLTPFLLTFIAAWIHRYPYGDSARLCQHLAPSICLMIGAGCVWTIAAVFRTVRTQSLAYAVSCGFLAVVGLGGIARDLIQPYKTTGDQDGRRIVQTIADQAGAECPIVLLSDFNMTQPEFIWYLHQHHSHVLWQNEVDWTAVAQNPRLIGVRFYHQTPPAEPLETALPDVDRTWQEERHDVHTRVLALRPPIVENVEVVEFHRR